MTVEPRKMSPYGRKGDIEQERAEEVDGIESGGEGQDGGSGSSGGVRAARWDSEPPEEVGSEASAARVEGGNTETIGWALCLSLFEANAFTHSQIFSGRLNASQKSRIVLQTIIKPIIL